MQSGRDIRFIKLGDMSIELLLEGIFALPAGQIRDGAVQKMLEILDTADATKSQPAKKPSSATALAKKSSPKKKKQNQKNDSVAETALKPSDKVILNRLKAWRKQVAIDLEIQPFIVFNNETLVNIAFYKPQNEGELLKIKGVAGEKAGKYGGTILELVKGENVEGVEEDTDLPKKRLLKPNV